MTHALRTTLLKLASLSLVAFGLLNVFALFTPLDAVMAIFVNLAHLAPLSTEQALDNGAARLWIGISGGLLAGFGTTPYLVARDVYGQYPDLGRRIVLAAIMSWYVVDSAGSVAAGAPFNAVINLVFLACFAVPVLWPKPSNVPSSAAG